MKRLTAYCRGYRTVLVLLAWFGLIGQLVQMVTGRPPGEPIPYTVVKYFSFFTTQSNFLVAVWLSLSLWGRRTAEPFYLTPRVKGAVTSYITVTLMVYALVLASTWAPTGWERVISDVTHYLVPLGFILDWILYEKKRVYSWVYALQWLAYPLGYFIYSQVYGALTGNYLYSFLNRPALGWGGLAVQVGFLLLIFLALAAIYILANRAWPQEAGHA